MAAVSHLAAMLLQLLCVEEFLMQMSLEKKFLTFFQFCSFMSSIFHPQFLSSKYWKQFNLKLQWKMHFGYRTPKVIISLRNIVETLTHCYCLFSSILLCHLPIVLPLCFCDSHAKQSGGDISCRDEASNLCWSHSMSECLIWVLDLFLILVFCQCV